MNYTQFKEEITQKVSEYIGEEGEVRLHTVIKNNSVKLDGISVFSENNNVSPTIYLNDFYKSYKEGEDIEELVRDITHIFQKRSVMFQCPNMDFFKDFEKVSKNIVFKIVNYNRNLELLDNIPHIKYLNFAVVFYYILSKDNCDNATVLINNKHLELWDKNVNEIAEIASENTPDILECEIKKLSEIILEEMEGEIEEEMLEEMEAEDTPMYVMTNKKRIYGAACILYPNLIRDFANQLDNDIYILPSSVHEVILVPANKVDNSKELEKMVREVNLTQVAVEEVLSDNVYIFNREDNAISMIN